MLAVNPIPKLIIELLENGKVNATGPLTERLLCYGLLVEAMFTIHEFGKANQKGTELPSIGMGGINPNSTWRPPSS